jgi:hypothetical protein
MFEAMLNHEHGFQVQGTALREKERLLMALYKRLPSK